MSCSNFTELGNYHFVQKITGQNCLTCQDFDSGKVNALKVRLVGLNFSVVLPSKKDGRLEQLRFIARL